MNAQCQAPTMIIDRRDSVNQGGIFQSAKQVHTMNLETAYWGT